MTTSARASRSRPASVRSSGSHGPAPTSDTNPDLPVMPTDATLSALVRPLVVVVGAGHAGLEAAFAATGTFLGGILHTGESRTPGGRVGEAPASGLSLAFAELGLTLRRLKTGTPPRLDGRTIDYAALQLQPSEDPAPTFVWAD